MGGFPGVTLSLKPSYSRVGGSVEEETEAPQFSTEASSSSLSRPSDGAQPSSSTDASQAAEFPLRTLADAPVDNDAADRFGYGDIADGLARLIEGEGTATPLTIAISAPWGAGKTSLLRLVEDRVVRQRANLYQGPTIVVWFNAWMHDAAPNLSAALAADIARHATRCRALWVRLWHPLPSSMLSPKERARRRFWLGVVALISSIVIYQLAYWLISPPKADVTKVRATFGAWAVGWFALVWGVSFLWPRVQRSVAALAAFVDDPRAAAATGSMNEVSAQLGELIREAQEGMRRAWGARRRPRFVVVVDDLERCQPPKAVDVCEVAAQLLDHPDVITVLVGDLRVIAASAELKYRDAATQFSNDADFAAHGFGRFFLQKVVQFELELPSVPGERIRQLARSAPATASVRGSGAAHLIPKPPLAERFIRDVYQVYGFGLAFLVLFVSFLVYWYTHQPHFGMTRPPPVPIFVKFGYGAFLITSLTSFYALYALRRRRRRIEDLRREVGSLVENVISDVLTRPDAPIVSDDLEAEVMSQLAPLRAGYQQRRYWQYAEALASPEQVRRQLQLHAAADEKTRSSAEKAILELLPQVPRTAKRLLNRLYFLLVVAYNRNLLTLGRVSAEQLGKWAVLLDRWPEAGRAITKNLQLAQSLEDAAGQKDEFASLCSAYTPPLASDPGPLRGFFQADPKLGAVACYLVYLDADVEIPSASDAPAIEPTAEAKAAAVASADDVAPAPEAVPNGRSATSAPI
jgi:hypothetical protein